MAIETTNGTPIMVGGNDGFGFGNGGFMAFLIFALLMGNGFGGWGNNGFANAIGYENLATSNEVQRGFDNQNQMANQREILSAVNDASARGIATTNQVYHDVVSYVGDKYDELARDLTSLAVGQGALMAKEQECCCNILRAVDGVNYNGAINTAAINANITAQVQSIKDMLYQQREQAQAARIQSLELQQAMTGVLKFPMGWAYTGGYFPPLQPTTGGTTTA